MNIPARQIGWSTEEILLWQIAKQLNNLHFPIGGGGTGTVSDFVFTNANGFTGVVSTSTTIPTLSITLQDASGSQSGQLTSADWVTFNNKQAALGFTPYNATNPANYISLTGLSATTPLNYNNVTGLFTITLSTTSTDGYLSSTDWNIFNSKQSNITATTSADYYRGDKTFQPLNKSAVGLSLVDNTADVSKPVSTAQQIAIDAKVQNSLSASTSVAPSATAVNTGLASKVTKTTQVNSSTVTFTDLHIYNSSGTPSTSDIVMDLTAAELGTVQMFYSNKAVEPVYTGGATMAKMGDTVYVPSVLNAIFFKFAGGTRVEYWYSQFS